MDQPRNVRKLAKWHNLFNEYGHQLSPLQDGNTLYFPALDEFFAPLVDINRLENMVMTDFKVTDYQIMIGAETYKPIERDPIETVEGPVNIGNGIIIKIPRRGNLNQYEPDWQKYLLDRQLQVKPQFSSTSQRANLWPLAGNDTEYCVPNMLAFANLSYLSNRVAPFLIPAGTYDTTSPERVFHDLQDLARSKQWFRWVDMDVLCSVLQVNAFHEAPDRIMAIIYGMCYALAPGGFRFDVITQNDITYSHTFANAYALTAGDLNAMSNYLIRTTPFDINVLGELLYPRYANVGRTWHDDAGNSPIPTSRVYSVPAYNVVDHILTSSVGGQNSGMWFIGALRSHVAILRMMMLQTARYMGGDPLIKHLNLFGSTLEGNRNMFIRQRWPAGSSMSQDYVPMELIHLYGGTVPEAKKFYGGAGFSIEGATVENVNGQPHYDGAITRVLVMTPHSPFVSSIYTAAGSVTYYDGKGRSVIMPRVQAPLLISRMFPICTHRHYGKLVERYGILNNGGASLGVINWGQGPTTFGHSWDIGIPDTGLNW